MGSLVLTGDTSGSVTVAVPAVAGTNTATFPASTGTVMVSGNMPAFSAYLSATQTISNATNTLLQFNTVTNPFGYDTASAFNTSTYSYNPKVAGYYLITANISGPASVTGVLNIFLYKNASNIWTLSSLSNTAAGVVSNSSMVVYLNGSTDTIQLYAYQNSGTSQSVFGGSGNSFFQASMIRSA